MRTIDHTRPSAAATIENGILYVSLELALRKWLVTSLSPGSTKMARREVSGGDLPALLDLIARLRAQGTNGKLAEVVVIQEVGMDGFWIHRALGKEGVESWLVDTASVAVSRRHRRAPTPRSPGSDPRSIGGERDIPVVNVPPTRRYSSRLWPE